MKNKPNRVILTTLIIASILCACDNKENENPIPLVDFPLAEKFVESIQRLTQKHSHKIQDEFRDNLQRHKDLINRDQQQLKNNLLLFNGLCKKEKK